MEAQENQVFSKIGIFNYQLNRWYHSIGEIAYEDLKAIGESVTTMGEYIEAFLKLAKLREEQGEIKKAAYYYRAAEFFMSAEAPNKQVLRKKVVALMKQVFKIKEEQRVEVPYKETFLPAYEFQVPMSKGTIVIFGGYDSYIEELTNHFKYFNAAGYHVIAFEGPGQGSALEDNQLVLEPCWELPVKCVLDYFGLEDVTLIGMSLGAILAIRAAAYEKRVKRVIAFDAMYDFYECYKAQCPPAIQTGLDALLESGQKEKLNGIMADSMRRNPRASWTIHQGMHVTGTETPFDYLMAMRNFTTRGCAHLVEQDVMLMAGTKDDYIPLEMLYKQMQVLTNAKSITARVFTEADHAQDHCQMSNIKLALETIIDWMEQMKPCQ